MADAVIEAQKRTNKPTAERILKAFSAISLTIIKTAAGEDIVRRLTPLSGLQGISCNGWDWVSLSMGSLKFRELEPDGANRQVSS